MARFLERGSCLVSEKSLRVEVSDFGPSGPGGPGGPGGHVPVRFRLRDQTGDTLDVNQSEIFMCAMKMCEEALYSRDEPETDTDLPGTCPLVLNSGGCPIPYLGHSLCESYNQ